MDAKTCQRNTGVGQWGQGRGTPPPPYKILGAQVGLYPPQFWTDQMFLIHYLLIFCG